MQFSLLSIVSVALAVVSQVTAKAQNGAFDSCSGVSLADGHILFATCENTAGTGSDSTSIDLNGCVENFAGTLECAVKSVSLSLRYS
ncbi:hypothetical protein A0H81_02769 [Grifola frondosa]|uniref:Cyanovirin-N domain-containing protein n=1 Tax=Grifola frondosa TaxID=5627 RepID=A0A1C7ML74_GRIFR|nr:hypothetical protein A0H81_02769 [Grifola frondosa]